MPQFPTLFSAADDGAEQLNDLSRAVVTLLKGVVYRDANESLWHRLLQLQSAVNDYVNVIGLQLMLDEAEGYAWLTSVEPLDPDEALPRLVARRPLSFPVSLILALLRKRLVESDAADSASRLVLSRDQIFEMTRVFLPRRFNEVLTVKQLDHALGQIAQMGFVRRMAGDAPLYEVRRIIKAFVDAEWLHDFDAKLSSYLAARGMVKEAGEDADGN